MKVNCVLKILTPQGYTSQLPPLAALLRQESRLLFITSLKAPKAEQLHVLAYFSVWAELAAIPVRTREPLLGHLRLAWWRDGLSGTHSDAHPALEALRQIQDDGAALLPLCDVVAAILDGTLSREDAARGLLGEVFAHLAERCSGDAAIARQLGAAVQLAAFDVQAAGLLAPAPLSKPLFPASCAFLEIPRLWLSAALSGRRQGHHSVGLRELWAAV
ncbi:MAG: hypothetical protein INF44_05020 [Thalassospira sp.]|nr:hypothetical protein [Thalassospira sp.]